MRMVGTRLARQAMRPMGGGVPARPTMEKRKQAF